MTKRERYEFFLLTVTAGLTGAVLYGLLGASIALTTDEGLFEIWGRNTLAAVIQAALMGAYMFFSLTSGILFTAKWLLGKSLGTRLRLTVLFFIPVQLAMLGIVYSIPYGIYNYIQYRKNSLR